MKPLAFRIREFKSIVDSGICPLSADGITVLAGQNEAGKTAALTALRDFDLSLGSAPQTQDYKPDDRFDAIPSVSVQFQADDLVRILSDLEEESKAVPPQIVNRLRIDPTFWITRNLPDGQYVLDPELSNVWTQADTENNETLSDGDGESTSRETEGKEASKAPTELKPDEFASWLRDSWPAFVYFDSFQDSLPRQVELASLLPQKKSVAVPSTADSTAQANTPTSRVPISVKDFVVLSDLDLQKVAVLAEEGDQDKMLENYLANRSAAITGDFLAYWKQKVDKDETVTLRVRHTRDSEGTLKLAFYVYDKSNQYPDQRSKGFLWFLSFYLRLAAAQKKEPDRRRVLLIDEPGSYLHARAQRDVLHLFEDRISKSDQIIYTTHSPYLLPANRLHRLRIVLKTSASGSKILDRLTHPDLRGEEFADSLSPVIAAIGIDITQAIHFSRERNLFVEGISDYMYLMAWANHLVPEFVDKFNVFPGTGATTVPMLASLFIGWGFKFITFLDNDDQGRATREKLTRELAVPSSRIIQPKDTKTIEDLFSPEDFRRLLHEVDRSFTLNTGELPSSAVKRQHVDKVLLSRTYSEVAVTQKWVLTKKSQDAIGRVFADFFTAW